MRAERLVKLWAFRGSSRGFNVERLRLKVLGSGGLGPAVKYGGHGLELTACGMELGFKSLDRQS